MPSKIFGNSFVMNVHATRKYTLELLSFLFNLHINQVYPCLLNPKFLNEKGGILGFLLENEFQIKKINEKQFILYNPQQDYSLTVQINEVFKDLLSKTIIHKIIAVNGINMETFLVFKINLYSDSSNNSTLLTIEIEGDNAKNPITEYLMMVIKRNNKENIFTKLNLYFNNSNRKGASFESIVINRPIRQIYDYIIDLPNIIHQLKLFSKTSIIKIGEKTEGECYYIIDQNKEGKNYKFTLKKSSLENKGIIHLDLEILGKYKKVSRFTIVIFSLSSISSFVTFEYKTKFHVDLNCFQSMSEIHQCFLKKLKKTLESKLCQLPCL